MTTEEEIFAELQRMVGIEAPPEVFEIEKGHIRKFADAIGDPNPLYCDEEYSKKSRHGGIIAPPTFLLDDGTIAFGDKLMEDCKPEKGFLNGGIKMECYHPMKTGDVITTRAKLSDVYMKQGKAGAMIFMTVEVSYTNQKGELAATGRHNFIRR
ncbi:MaoC family dehydratase N-terminal domain-containing protein [Chloroflexota bacterium]